MARYDLQVDTRSIESAAKQAKQLAKSIEQARETVSMPRHKNEFDLAAKVLFHVLRPKTYAKMMLTAKE